VRLAGGAIAFATILGCGDSPEPARPRPNVVLAVIDTLRADHSTTYGYERLTTPRLGEFAARGLLAEQAYAQASWTLPSMASMLTGRYAVSERRSIPEEATTLAERFAAAGYATVAIVANPILLPDQGFAQGFDHYHVADSGPGLAAKALTAEKLTAMALETIATLEEPYFVWLQYFDPHAPYAPPQPFMPKYPRRAATVEAYRARIPVDSEFEMTDDHLLAFEMAVARYDGEVRRADAAFGTLHDELDARGMAERTIFVVTSDHGEGLYEHADNRDSEPMNPAGLYMYHGDHQYEEAVRIPLVMFGPGFAARRIRGPVENVDIAPTLLAAAGLASDPGAVGVDLRTMGDDGKPLVHSFGQRANSIRSREGLKLIEPAEYRLAQGIPTEMYDLAVDPDERRDIGSQRSDDHARLRRALHDWRAAHAAGLPPESGNTPPALDQRLRELGYVR
jgi:choline-sulfatase